MSTKKLDETYNCYFIVNLVKKSLYIIFERSANCIFGLFERPEANRKERVLPLFMSIEEVLEIMFLKENRHKIYKKTPSFFEHFSENSLLHTRVPIKNNWAYISDT